MILTFRVPEKFAVFGMLAGERVPCLVDCRVVELVRWQPSGGRRFSRGFFRLPEKQYMAYVVLPGWITAPPPRVRVADGTVCLEVSRLLNRRWEPPAFPAGRDRIEIGS